MSEYPSDWIESTFSRVCHKILDGTHFSPRSKSGPRLYLTSKNIKDGRISLEDISYISDEEHREIYSRCDVKKGDILLTKDGANTGNAAINPLSEEFSLLSSVAVIRPDGEKCDTGYAFQWLTSDGFQALLKARMAGNAISRLTLQKINNLPIALPPLPEQKKIAEILSGIDLLTQKIKTKITKLKEARSAFIQNLHLEDPGEWVALEEFADFVTSGSRGWSQYYSDTGAKFVRIGNLSRDSIDLDPAPDKWQLVAPPEGAEGARTRLEEGDILISITADLGICGIYSARIGEAYINQHIALVRVHSESRHFSRQIAYYICSDHCQEQIRSMNDSGAKAGLNLDSIRRIRVPLIQGGANSRIIRSIDSLQSAISGNLLRLQRLAYEKSALASDLLSGRKRVTL
jgi:type I restriction enzyme S subunit